MGIAAGETDLSATATRQFMAYRARAPGERPARRSQTLVGDVPFDVLAEGCLWQPGDRLLVVADLHLEKASSFARRGELLPPYDTAATLAALSALVFNLDPVTVIALGDSFHDNDGANRLGAYDRRALHALQRGREWIWIAGNHDDDLPDDLVGERVDAVSWQGVEFRHEPTPDAAAPEIAGHLHPAARVYGRRGSVRRKCFVGDETRLILPAFGALTGGLNVLAPVFKPLFPGGFTAYVLSSGGVYPVSQARLHGR